MSRQSIPTLEQTQRLFSRALRHHSGLQSIDIVTDGFEQSERLSVYQNNFIISLTEVLLATYPVTHLLVGEECFNSIARHHILRHPPQHGNVAVYGADFDHTIGSLSNIINAVPYLVDVVRVEYMFDQLTILSAGANEQAFIPISKLHKVPQHAHPNLVFVLTPNLILFQSNYAIASLFAAIDGKHLHGLDMNNAESCVITMESVNAKASISSVNPRLFDLLSCLHQSLSLSQIEPDLLSLLPDALTSGFIQGFVSRSPIPEDNL